MNVKQPWWESGIIYQIYPRSFQDSNNDGIGDLRGIRSRLSYLQDLGITAIWLSPIYPSPMVDFGYDVSNYTGIDPLFGTLQDFREFLEDAQQRGMKVILDFVPNHTSDQHRWFLESRSGRENPRRDWYIWKEPKSDGSPPNNWVSYFGGSAWEWDEQTEQYYLHLFTKEQPDLNWRNPEVIHAMLNVLRFWLELGVDGFRGDVISLIIKDASFRDDTVNPEWTPSQPIIRSTLHDRSQHQPESHDLIRKMRAVLEEYGDRVLIGEIYLPYERLMSYYGDNLDECHLPYNFGLLTCPFQAESIIALVNEYEGLLPKGAWPNWVLGNHDKDRIASENRAGEANARLAQMLLLTLRGTPTMYYGDELGMPNGDIPPEKFQDPAALNEPGIGQSRDLARTPMQWDETAYAGFSQVDSWLPVSRDFGSRNVASQEATPRSFLQMVKQLIAIRQSSPALSHGHYSPVPVGIPDVMAYLRIQGEVKILVVLNFSDEEKIVDLSSTAGNGKVMLSTTMDRNGDLPLQTLKLRQHEGLMIQLI
jgi:alpha-glucosidase